MNDLLQWLYDWGVEVPGGHEDVLRVYVDEHPEIELAIQAAVRYVKADLCPDRLILKTSYDPEDDCSSPLLVVGRDDWDEDALAVVADAPRRYLGLIEHTSAWLLVIPWWMGHSDATDR